MPKVADLPGRLRVSQYHRDHDPPHFHVSQAGSDVLIAIADFTILRGSIRTSDLAVVKMWAARHQADLALNWVLARAGLELRDIEYP